MRLQWVSQCSYNGFIWNRWQLFSISFMQTHFLYLSWCKRKLLNQAEALQHSLSKFTQRFFCYWEPLCYIKKEIMQQQRLQLSSEIYKCCALQKTAHCVSRCYDDVNTAMNVWILDFWIHSQISILWQSIDVLSNDKSLVQCIETVTTIIKDEEKRLLISFWGCQV